MGRIKALVSDVDGVLTDGTLFLDKTGEESIKGFHVKDGMGIVQSIKAGFEFAIITGRSSKPLDARVKKLNISHFYCGVENKLIALQDFMEKTGLNPDEIAYIGDDINDLGVMSFLKEHGGEAYCPSDAVNEVQSLVNQVLPLAGGRGVVRYLLDLLRKS
jgi:3-deoxy-D-manno-octulosonate 8-phosphate phosphatase (KDO 8-P phosphatase)